MSYLGDLRDKLPREAAEPMPTRSRLREEIVAARDNHEKTIASLNWVLTFLTGGGGPIYRRQEAGCLLEEAALLREESDQLLGITEKIISALGM